MLISQLVTTCKITCRHIYNNFYINTSAAVTVDKITSIWTYLQYNLFGTGYLSAALSEGTGFLYTDGSTHDMGTSPDIQLHFLSSVFFDRRNRNGMQYNFNTKIKDRIYTQKDGQGSFLMIPILLHPKSKGTIRLKSTDPFDHPAIDPHYFEHPDDLATFLKGIRLCEKMARTPSMKKIGVSTEDDSPLFQVCEDYRHGSDEYWKCYLQHYSFPIYHPTSTCRMGSLQDTTAVVDPQLRVRDIRGLRVVDASVMRNVPSGNTNAASILIAEKAADLIRGINSVQDIIKKLENVL